MDCVTQKQLDALRHAREQIQIMGTQNQRREIMKTSPYSERISSCIRQYAELRLYSSLRLQECYITRPTIIQDIDFDLWVTAENCTNAELMRKGHAPYAYDSMEGRIELHHIGQNYSAPFAELTFEEHKENSQLLHLSKEESWRKDQEKEKAFMKERSIYWKKRAKRDYTVTSGPFLDMQPQKFLCRQDYLAELRKTCEVIYNQCGVDELDYLSDLARSYAMMHRVGAMTMGEFLKTSRNEQKTAIRCPSCKSNKYVLSGTYQAQGERVQRYKCKKCGKVFSLLNKTLVSGSSFSFKDWIKFIDCLYHGYTIKQIAKSCDISERTAHENRTKLFYALKLLNDKVRLQGNVVLDETYLPVSFKGNHSRQEDFVMPRKANERGGENHKKGLSDNLVCIICAVDGNGNSVAKVAGVGASSAARVKYVLKEHMSEDILCLYSDKSRTLRRFAESCGLEIRQEKLLRKGTQYAAGVPLNKTTFEVNHYLQIINNYHSRLKKFLNRFSGISTKYLSGYLYLFAWRERNKEREPEEAYRELLQIMTEPNHYLSAEDIAKDGHIPDAASINEQYRKRQPCNHERDMEIYRRYAAGETMASIGADYGFTRQNISLIVQSLRKNGFAYRTEQDIQRENAQEPADENTLKEGQLVKLKRNFQIYSEKLAWEGSAVDFHEMIANEYGMTASTAKNIVSKMKRITNLKEEMFVYEDVSYQSLKEVYQSVYSDYSKLKDETPNLSDVKCAEKLGPKYGFTPSNILRICNIMRTDTSADYLSKKRKLTKTETYNRDKAVFIDYLRWTADKQSFYKSAAQKYQIAPSTVHKIILYCLYADPDRCCIA